MELHDTKKFWNNVHKLSNGKDTKFATCIDGVTGDSKIASMWKNHFEQLYNSVPDDESKNKFLKRISNISTDSDQVPFYITL
jgi:hypothetical protein